LSDPELAYPLPPITSSPAHLSRYYGPHSKRPCVWNSPETRMSTHMDDAKVGMEDQSLPVSVLGNAVHRTKGMHATKILFCIMTLCAPLLAFAAPEPFAIVIQRHTSANNLVTGTISLNGTVVGAAYENDDLKIPAGTYKGIMRYTSQKGFVQGEGGAMANEGDFLIEASNVSDATRRRTNILLHGGNKPQHSQGCILLGAVGRAPNGQAQVPEGHPLRTLRLAFYGTDTPIASPNKAISITILNPPSPPTLREIIPQ